MMSSYKRQYIKLLIDIFPFRVELIDPPELASIPYSLQKTEQQSLTSNLKQTTHYLNFGYILLGGFIERQITLYNPTNITLNFQIQIDENQTGGSRNLNGLPVFMVLPNQGKIKPGTFLLYVVFRIIVTSFTNKRKCTTPLKCEC